MPALEPGKHNRRVAPGCPACDGKMEILILRNPPCIQRLSGITAPLP
ncbi:protein of unknown function [Georgfuchsia toluolica]|uniref:Uncharacterized protein n=1 Tax=Georgfuchsia toluolica TaxID=424218 RepID=A0A916J452_9PROT|nr:protein of unknown function [Georgfuchsia toluolica]